jgi:hypothetical protein
MNQIRMIVEEPPQEIIDNCLQQWPLLLEESQNYSKEQLRFLLDAIEIIEPRLRALSQSFKGDQTELREKHQLMMKLGEEIKVSINERLQELMVLTPKI